MMQRVIGGRGEVTSYSRDEVRGLGFKVCMTEAIGNQVDDIPGRNPIEIQGVDGVNECGNAKDSQTKEEFFLERERDGREGRIHQTSVMLSMNPVKGPKMDGSMGIIMKDFAPNEGENKGEHKT